MADRHIIAGSGGFQRINGQVKSGPIIDYILKATKKDRPKFCYINTANGDSAERIESFYNALSGKAVDTSHLALFPWPNHEDLEQYILSQDAIYVGGGSAANLIAVWEVHGLFNILRKAWENGTVLSGVSAGSLCWSAGGTTDSFGPKLRPIVNKNNLLPYSSGVHYDSEEQRRPLFQKLIGEGTIPDGYATDDGVMIHFKGTEFHKAITDTEGKKAYRVYKDKDGSVKEDIIEPELLRPQA